MGVDTKGFVTVGKDKLYDVMDSLLITLKKRLRKEVEDNVLSLGEGSTNKNVHKVMQGPDAIVNYPTIFAYTFDCISVNFKTKGRLRSLKVLPGCSCDHEEVYVGDKITFMLGCWGDSAEIMEEVLKDLEDLGKVYICRNDCTDDFEELNRG